MDQLSGESSIPDVNSGSRKAVGLRFFEALADLPLSWRIGACVVVIAAACGARFLLSDYFDDRSFYFSFYPAIAVNALLFGSYSGVAAVVIAIVVNHIPFGHENSSPFNDPAHDLILGVFLLNSSVLIFLVRLLHHLARARREGEELIRINAEQLGQFIEQTPAAMAMFDRDMRYIAASARWRADYALSQNVVGKSSYELTPEAPDDWRDVHQRVLAGESLSCDQDLLKRPDGSSLWLHWEARPWRLAGDVIGGVVIFAEDITERISIQEAMRENEKRLVAIVDAAMEAIISIDGKGAIQSANPAAREMFGYDASELLGQNLKLLMPSHYRSEHDRYLANYLGGGEKKLIGLRRRVEGLRKDGTAFPLELTVGEASLNHDILFVGFLRDLSPIEEERRRVNALRDELVHVSRLNDMGEVVAGLAHEVGQPVAAILNFAAAHRRAMASTGKAPEPDLIAKIELQARRAADIIKRLRGFIEKRPPERSVEKIQDLIDDAIKLGLLRSRGPILRIPPGGEADIRVCVDRIQIEQVLVNLLRNADDALVDAVEPEIIVETSCDASGMVRVSIADNGAGIDGEAMEQLFAPFFSTKKYGMGVGLSIGKSIIENHGGVIGYRANAPRGSIFEFTLPIFRDDAANETPGHS